MAKNMLRAALIATFVLPSWACAQERAAPDPEPLVALLRAGKYAELDAQVAAYQAAYEASTEREWDLVVVIAGFERVDPELEAYFTAWTQAQPKSYVARLARAAYWHQRAWSSRGARGAGKTADSRMEAMRRYFEQSEAELKASLALSPRPQLSHRYLIASGMARGDGNQMWESFQAALRLDPECYAARRAYLNSFRPQWGGSVEQMQKLIDHTASFPQTPKTAAVTRKLKASLLGYHALQAEGAKNYPAALELYARGLAEIEDALLLANRSRVLLQLKRQDDALRDLDRALALDPASSEAYERRGILREQRKQMKEAVSDYARAASYGSAYSIQRLGIHYLDAEPPNDPPAMRLLTLGAELGDDRAQMALGYMYSEGRGAPQDLRKAYDLWGMSAAQGNEQAKNYLDSIPWHLRARFAVEDWFR